MLSKLNQCLFVLDAYSKLKAFNKYFGRFFQAHAKIYNQRKNASIGRTQAIVFMVLVISTLWVKTAKKHAILVFLSVSTSQWNIFISKKHYYFSSPIMVMIWYTNVFLKCSHGKKIVIKTRADSVRIEKLTH